MKHSARLAASLIGVVSIIAIVTIWTTPAAAQRIFQGVTLQGTLTSPGDTAVAVDSDGRIRVSTDSVNRFSCTVSNSSATTLTALGGSCVAPGAGKSLYVTDIQASASAASTTTADQQLELKSGTGGTCGTGTAVVWNQFGGANGAIVATFSTPLKMPANSELCWMDAVAGNKSFVVTGFIGP